MKAPNLSLNPDTGEITRVEDSKLVATVVDGKINYAAPAYAKAKYKETIEDLVSDAGPLPWPKSEEQDEGEYMPEEDELPPPITGAVIPTEEPPRDPQLGAYTVAHINWDHSNLDDEAFAAKYGKSFECWLELTAERPGEFADLANLENRFASLAKG